MASSSSNQSPSSFYKIYQPPYNSDTLFIPQHFKTLNKPQTVLLQDLNNKCWRVKLEKTKSRLAMTEGWERFVKAHDLTYGDWLLFTYMGKSLITVKIFGLDCCVKNHYIPTTSRPQRESQETNEADPMMKEKIKFSKVLGKELPNYMELPVRFERMCNAKPQEVTVLRTKRGEACKVTFRVLRRKLAIVSPSLKKFWRMADVEPRDKCDFQAIIGSHRKVDEIILVQVSRYVPKDLAPDDDEEESSN